MFPLYLVLQVTVFHLFHFVLIHKGSEAVFRFVFFFQNALFLSIIRPHAIIPELPSERKRKIRMYGFLRKFRVLFAILLCKLLRAFSRLLHHGGTAMPGRIALKLCPDLLVILSKEVRTIAVTGTNGKTTCSRMIEEACSAADKDYFSNRSGANLLSGVTTEFVMNASLTGKMRKHTAVIECDEAAARRVFGQLQPAVIVVTNLFRDQLDRYGEITHTLSNIREGIRAVPDAVLCLNADCSLTASLSLEDLPNPIRWFGVDGLPNASTAAGLLSDASHCIRCKAEYVYDYHTYAHLGGFRCPRCGYHRQRPDYAVTEILKMDDRHSEVRFRTPSGETILSINLPAVYNLYNAAAAYAAASSFGCPDESCTEALSRFSCGFGRMESFPLAGGTRMILVKNPAGCTQALDFLTHITQSFLFVFCLNDRDADGTDVSWIWDADFEMLQSITDHIPSIVVSGDRAADMRLRLKYAGLDDEKILVIQEPSEVVRYLSGEHLPVYILPTYTAMLDLRKEVVRYCGGTEFWE